MMWSISTTVGLILRPSTFIYVARRGADNPGSVLHVRLVRIAVEPAFPGLRGRHHRVRADARVLAGVPVRRRVAAAGLAACLARAQMDPLGPDPNALHALPLRGLLDVLDLLQVSAGLPFHGATSVPAPRDPIPRAARPLRTCCSGTRSTHPW